MHTIIVITLFPAYVNEYGCLIPEAINAREFKIWHHDEPFALELARADRTAELGDKYPAARIVDVFTAESEPEKYDFALSNARTDNRYGWLQ